jgi:hypothetical protein
MFNINGSTGPRVSLVSATRVAWCTVAAATVLLAGCPSDEPRTKLALSSTTPAQRDRLVHATIGFENAPIVLVGLIDPMTQCPTVVDSGTTRTVTGGCTDKEGTKFTGKIVAQNVVGARDAAKPSVFDVQGFGFTELKAGGDDLVINGKLTALATAITTDLTVTNRGEGVRTAITVSEVGAGLRIEPGGTVELVGAGYVDAVGEWDASARTGSIELRGLDVLKVDISKITRDARGDCAPVTLDGVAAGEICDF